MENWRIYRRKSLRSALRAGLKCVKAERGQALVELAISVPLLTLLMYGCVEMGKIVYASIAVSDAAMAGVQYGTRNSTAAADAEGIENAAAADAPELTITTTPTISCICSDGSASTCQPTDCPGASIETILTVKTQATVDPLVHLPGLPNTLTVQGQAIQKVLQ